MPAGELEYCLCNRPSVCRCVVKNNTNFYELRDAQRRETTGECRVMSMWTVFHEVVLEAWSNFQEKLLFRSQSCIHNPDILREYRRVRTHATQIRSQILKKNTKNAGVGGDSHNRQMNNWYWENKPELLISSNNTALVVAGQTTLDGDIHQNPMEETSGEMMKISESIGIEAMEKIIAMKIIALFREMEGPVQSALKPSKSPEIRETAANKPGNAPLAELGNQYCLNHIASANLFLSRQIDSLAAGYFKKQERLDSSD